MGSLALKYRPQTFQDLVGQLSASRSLKNAIEHNRISHAYLFFGARGVGKTSTARILARALNCVTGPTITPCGTCENCKDIAAGTSMDVVEMDAASNRGIDSIRELRETIRFAPMKSKYRIYIVDEVHMLTPESFNALLKTLEEPPAHVVFIMATTEIHKIPETILSRCQTFAFRKFSIEEIRDRLVHVLKSEQTYFEDDAFFQIAQRAEGSMRDALSILDQVCAFAAEEKLSAKVVLEALGVSSEQIRLEFLEAIRRREIKDALQVIDKLHTEGLNLRRFLWDSLSAMKDLALFHHSASLSSLSGYSSSQTTLLKEYASRWDTRELNAVFSTLYNIYAGWNQFPNSRGSEIRVSLEMAIFHVIEKLNSPSVSSLLSRLNALKSAIETGKTHTDKKPDVASVPTEKKPTTEIFSQPEKKPIPQENPYDSTPPAQASLDAKSILESEFMAEPGSDKDRIFGE